MFLKHYETTGFLKNAWAGWFESLFRWNSEEDFIKYLWRIGIRHVEVNLDQRYSNLAFSVSRQFCENIILKEIPAGKRDAIFGTVNRLIDFCMLVETDAYIEARARCDMEIVMGVADRVRNKSVVISGNIKRLQRKTDMKDPVYDVYESVLSNSSAFERMITDVRVYVDISQKEPELRETALEMLITKAVGQLESKEAFRNVTVETALDKKAQMIFVDAKDMESMFYYLLENSFEAVDPKNPYIKISSISEPSFPRTDKGRDIQHRRPFERGSDSENLFSIFFDKADGDRLWAFNSKACGYQELCKALHQACAGSGHKGSYNASIGRLILKSDALRLLLCRAIVLLLRKYGGLNYA